jgi:hypothetical protein
MWLKSSGQVQGEHANLPPEERRIAMAEDVQILRLVRAFQKIRNQRRRREVVELAEAAAEAEKVDA